MNFSTIKVAILALENLQNRQRRRNLMIIILTPAITLLLLIAFIFHILTSPLATFGDWFLPEELAAVEDLQITYGYNQNLGIFEDDYLNGSGKNYENVVFADGEVDVVYYNQLDERWADLMYGTLRTIGEGGCGPTAMAMVVSTLTGEVCDPIEMSNWSVEHGYMCDGNGSYHSLIPAAATAYGLTCQGVGKNDGQKIVDALAEGKLLVAIMSKGHFTNSGHFILLRGVTSDGKILVADPISYSRSEQEWDLSIILDEASKGAAAGGPFWIIGN